MRLVDRHVIPKVVIFSGVDLFELRDLRPAETARGAVHVHRPGVVAVGRIRAVGAHHGEVAIHVDALAQAIVLRRIRGSDLVLQKHAEEGGGQRVH
eukprot:scaffold1405_cov225-Pinguiococcus_pyrenoidosus.AAC.1